MDVDSLKAELEEHLKKNPHPDAPGGFRDRFDAFVEQHAEDAEDFPKAYVEEQLQRIRDEAEAAWNAAEAEAGDAPRVGARGAPAAAPSVGAPSAPAADGGGAGDAAGASPGFLQQYGIALVAALIVLAIAYFYFR